MRNLSWLIDILMQFLYTLLLWLLLPYALIRLIWRARQQPEYLENLGERFGFYSIHSEKPAIWLHTVSVGETRAAQNLISQLHDRYPDQQILLTHSTPTGRATSEQLYGDKVLSVYLPYDYPFAIRRFLKHFKPRLGILMETEIWFNLISLCKSSGIPLLLLNARMSEKSAQGYARFAQLSTTAFASLTGILAQTKEDAFRLSKLGAKSVNVMGNLKFDIHPPDVAMKQGRLFRQYFGMARPVIVAASTRDGEESLIIDALIPLNFLGALLVIVPRHPQRFDEVAKLLERKKVTYQRRSENRPVLDKTQVVLGDSMGEMFAYYASADIAFIGGSLLPYGGQNLIEACAVGTPILTGMHTYNFADATLTAINMGAAIQINSAEALAQQLQFLLEHPDKIAAMREQCTEFVKRNQGATDKALQLVENIFNQATKPNFS